MVEASREINHDLFHGYAGSYGTLGLVTLLKVELVEAKPFVELTYRLVGGIDDAVATSPKACGDALNDHVDGIVFSKPRGAVVTAHFVDLHELNAAVQTFAQARDEWFYLHVERILNRESLNKHPGLYPQVENVKEIVPIQVYLFRYERGAFCTGRHSFSYFCLPFIYLLRRLFDTVLRTKVMYHGLHESRLAKDNLTQDVVIPMSQVSKFVGWVNEAFGVWPLWICPLRRDVDGEKKRPMNPHASSVTVVEDIDYAKKDKYPLSEKTNEDEADDEIGILGPRLADPRDFVNRNRRFERPIYAVGGMKWLYAHCHYSDNEFWSIYDQGWYDALRTKYPPVTCRVSMIR